MKANIIIPPIFFILMLTAPIFSEAKQHKMSAAQKEQTMDRQILTLVNEHRSKIGLKPLIFNNAINKEALGHSQNMASGSVAFGHDGFEQRAERLRKAIPNANGTGENVAYGSRTAEDVVKMWLNSPGHRKNIEGKFNLTGIGIAKSADGTLYYTQMFIKN